MQSTERSLGSGRVLGRYEILAPIATGGMAEVWAARLKGSRGFTKTVAIKTLLPGISDDVRFETMFLDEARIAARIRHGNVVSILDLGEDQEILYLVMEYVDGESLIGVRRAAVDAGGIPLRLALKVVADAAAGLHAAHQLAGDDGTPLGIVHRDVSPQNILISFDGRVMVTDFGIAKAAGRISQTTERTLKGKPAFMAPEQIESGAVDARADVFALGIVMYQLIAGVHPFRGENDLATVSNILSKRPILPPSRHNRAVEPALEAIMMRALERDPAARFQSASDLESAIDELVVRTRRARAEELAELMERLLGERGQKRRQELRAAIERADRRAAGETSGEQIATGARISTAPGRPSGAPAMPDTPLTSVLTAPRERSPLRALALGAVLLGALVAGSVLLLRRPSSAPPSAPPEAKLSAAPANAQPLPEERSDPALVAPSAASTRRRARAPLPFVKRAPNAPDASPSAADAASAAASASAEPRPRKKGPVPVMDPGF